MTSIPICDRDDDVMPDIAARQSPDLRRRSHDAEVVSLPLAKIVHSGSGPDLGDARSRHGQVTLSLPTERELVRRWQQHGDRQALLRLIMTLRPFLTRIARRHGKSGAIEQDLIHEGIVAIIKGLEKYQPRDEIRLVSAVWRRVVTAMNLGRLRTERVIDAPLDRTIHAHRERCIPSPAYRHSSIEDVEESVLSDVAADPEHVALCEDDAKRNRETLMLAMNGLTELERQIIDGRLRESGLEELSEQLGLPASRVKDAESHALQKMRMRLVSLGYSGLNGEHS